MPYAFELALDPASAASVRQAWQELDDTEIEYMARSGAVGIVEFRPVKQLVSCPLGGR